MVTQSSNNDFDSKYKTMTFDDSKLITINNTVMLEINVLSEWWLSKLNLGQHVGVVFCYKYY